MSMLLCLWIQLLAQVARLHVWKKILGVLPEWRSVVLCCMYELSETQFLSLLSLCALEVLKLYFQLQFDLVLILKSAAQGEIIWFKVCQLPLHPGV